MKKILKNIILIFVVFIFFSLNRAYGVEDTQISFNEKNMYTKICNSLGEMVKEKDDSKYEITISTNDLNTITNLNLRNGQIKDISGIENFTALTTLDLSQNIISNVKSLKTLTNLKTLNLYDNVLSDLSGLETLTNLTTLKLGENNEVKKEEIANLSVLNNLTNLKTLDFSENYTSTILDNIDKLTNLEVLNLESNEITDISKISKLTKLKKLSLYKNSIEDITSLYGLLDLEELVLQSNKINNLTGMLDSENNLIWKNIKKLDIARNYQINAYKYRDILAVLCEMSENKSLQLNYEHITDTSNLPHYDSKGTAYVTYEDFGARCDGEYDDFIAMRNAHNFANENDYEVRGTAGKTYHIFNFYEDAANITTSTDWNGATIVIHDEQIDECSARNKFLFWSNTLKTSKVIENPSWTITKSTKKLTEISDILEEWNAQGYKEYYCVATNEDKKQFIRYGLNEDSGDSQQDIFIIDSEGNIKNELWWDFEKITSFTIYPMPEKSFELKNAKIISNALESKTDTPYTRAGTGKQIYYWRNFALNKCANVKISNIKHTLSTSGADDLSGSYHGIFFARNCANIEITDCELFARKYSEYYRSSYDLTIGNCINLVCKNVNSNDIYNNQRWSAFDMSYTKDVLFENCHLNKIGSHESASNVTIKDCEVGVRSLTFNGQGKLNIINTKVASNQFISLRDDFGSSWDGDVNIINCTYKYLGEYIGELFTFSFCYDDKENKKLHDFGFECKFPNVYAENLTIDLNNAKNKKAIHIIPNFPERIGNPYYGNPSYWPEKIHINGYEIINSPDNAILKLSATELDTDPNKKYNYIIDKEYKSMIAGDVDRDGNITVNDLAKIKLHLIGEEEIIDSVEFELADIDENGKITVNDLAATKLKIISL